MVLFAATVFLSAFLLFQVQPLIAKSILPWFGGTAAVWATCMVFFQVTLLAGYSYAHAIVSRVGRKRQRTIHSSLVALALVTLPIVPSEVWKPVNSDAPVTRILIALAATVGLPYLVLSSTGPLLQAWFAQSRPGEKPYRLFAVSNAGSLLGLLSYPFLVEPRLTLLTQAWAWSGAFGIFALCCVYAAWRSLRAEPQYEVPDVEVDPPRPVDRLLWVLLAMCASTLLLSVTEHLTADVASIPFLWILPLTVYLLSFILCFDTRGWYRRMWFALLLLPALGGMSYLLWAESEKPGIIGVIAVYLAGLFVACMFCHGEIAMSKPHPRFLTQYFLLISSGGALGGIFVGLVAPATFNSNYEFPAAIALGAILGVVVMVRGQAPEIEDGLFSSRGIFVMLVAAALCGFLARVMHDRLVGTMVVSRNFYGELRVRQYNGVYDWEGHRTLIHGTINHGQQWTHPARRREACTYYCADSGIGLALGIRAIGDPQRVGVVGLGTGSLALYARPGDAYRFYDINPEVQRIANAQFWYLKDAEAQVEVKLGDARLSLENEEVQHFDVLAVDAFAGDSIPVHLLTQQAMGLYFRHLKPGGVLAVHVSNHYLDLKPVLAAAAQELGLEARAVETEEKDECFGTTWVLVAAGPQYFQRPGLRVAKAIPVPHGFRSWTDDYSSLLNLLK